MVRARLPGQPGVHHDPHSRHRQARLRHRGRQDHPAPPARFGSPQHRVLHRSRCPPVQLQHLGVQVREQPRRPGDLPGAGQEAQQIALVPLQGLPDGGGDMAQQRGIHPGAVRRPHTGRWRREVDGRAVDPALGPHDRSRAAAAVQDRQQLGPRLRVARRRRGDQLQLRPQRRPHVHQERQRRVRVQMPLVALVEQHHVRTRQLRVALQPLEQHSRGHHLDPGRRTGPPLAAHGEADGPADLLAQQPGHPPGRRPHRHPARLGHQHPPLRPVPYESRERERDQRGLAGPGRGVQHRRAALLERGQQLGHGMTDGKQVECVVSDHVASLVRRTDRLPPVVHRARRFVRLIA